MTYIVRLFLLSSKIKDTDDGTVTKIMEFLTLPESVNSMIEMTKVGLPALMGVVEELENRFADSDFPLNYEGEHKNSANRRNIGWMIRFILREYGYAPIRNKQGSVVNRARYFNSGAVYEKVDYDPHCRLRIEII